MEIISWSFLFWFTIGYFTMQIIRSYFRKKVRESNDKHMQERMKRRYEHHD